MNYRPAFCRCGAGGYLAPPDEGDIDAPRSVFDLVPDTDAAPVAPPPRDQGVAIHEAAHAVVGHVLGFEIARVSIEWQPSVSWTCMAASRGLDRAAVALAGDHGARLILQRLEYRPPDDEVIRTFAVVRELRMGGCDDCAAALACFAATGADADDTDLLTVYREAEALAIVTLRESRVQQAVRVLADLLLANGQMLGPAIHDVLAAIGLPFASLEINKDPEN